jgi:hypothetical protein
MADRDTRYEVTLYKCYTFRKLANPYEFKASDALIQEFEAIETAASKITDHATHLQGKSRFIPRIASRGYEFRCDPVQELVEAKAIALKQVYELNSLEENLVAQGKLILDGYETYGDA